MPSSWHSTSSCSILTYARILFVDFSSAFNNILPALLQDKLNVPDSTCRWITDFLTGRRQCVRLGKNVSDTRTISTGDPQGCVLSPLLFSCTQTGTSSYDSVKRIKFADDTTLIGLILDGDKSVYRREVDQLVSWCSGNNLELNAQNTVEMIVDFRKVKAPPAPPHYHRLPHHHRRLPPLPLHHHHPVPQVGAHHQLPHQEGPAEDVLPAAAEESQAARADDGAVLNSHH
ncbi:uncharacterized protein [Eucyclogobius newberryi]|uniref:uncharacterized protein n=1 Tax=Eucyclogobius newberryi TaxID=166745 RepID=UPI003B5992C7